MEHSLEQALRQEYAYVKIRRFMTFNSKLFTPDEFKVLSLLYEMLSYDFDPTFVVASQTEIMLATGMKRQQAYKILTNLETKGLIVKTSGKHQKELALKLRERFFNRPQKEIRSYNEKNVYDLKPLLELLLFLMEVEKYLSKEEFFEMIVKAKKRPEKLLSARILAYIQENEEIATKLSSQMEIATKLSSDSNQLSSDSNCCHQMATKLLLPKKETATKNTHTHHTAGAGNRERMPEGKGLQEGLQEDVGEVVKTLTNAPEPEPAEPPPKPQPAPEPPEIEVELEEYIIAELFEQEKQGKIQNANAVFKTLTEKDIAMYKKKFEQEKKRKERRKYRVVVLANKELAKKIAEKINAKIYLSAKAYILCSVENAKKIKTLADTKHEPCEIREYTAEYEKYF